MTSPIITHVHGRQILDSRGRPTVEAEITLSDGTVARASVPSGASTGKAESVELRDGGAAWGGKAVGRAVGNINDRVASAVAGLSAFDQGALDARLVEVDGTDNFGGIGANAALAVSLATLRAGALAQRLPLYRWIATLIGVKPTMPLPMVNILSGGLHAGRGMDVQDFLAMPVGAANYSEALEWICRIRTTATELCAAQGLPVLLADEGGLSPGFERSEEALDMMVAAIEAAGLTPGKDVGIVLDIASSSLVDANGGYRFERLGETFDAAQMIDMQAAWIERYPIISIEDGLGEDDWAAWPALTERLGHIQLVGDDLFATQPARVQRGIDSGGGNAALIKVNQNGTVSGTFDAIRTARGGGFATVISARSGETEDDFLADLAVGVAGGQIKVGSVRNSERLAKYNQLLRIEEAGLPWAGASGVAPLGVKA
ncbi:phosphopyruvate hydratase [Sphingobium sp. HWE2-09]|uniref:phosphopyruvate hydratase n=1 Tax=Sphingobium sp. HWE2-09 TaxID=3108390 RepID=UPI002DC4D821|nr:phosphopyruvate hydratase [Sphingobium sp. HWE2-09]